MLANKKNNKDTWGGIAEFFRTAENEEHSNLAVHLYALGYPWDFTNAFIDEATAKTNDEISNNCYKILNPKDFYSDICLPESQENEDFLKSNKDAIPDEIVKKIGGAFEFLYQTNASSLTGLESLVSSDAKIKEMALSLKIHPKLARVCYDFLYDAAEHALRKQAKEMQKQHDDIIKEMSSECVIITYTPKEHVFKSEERVYAYNLGENFKLYYIGRDIYTNKLKMKSVDVKSKDLLGLFYFLEDGKEHDGDRITPELIDFVLANTNGHKQIDMTDIGCVDPTEFSDKLDELAAYVRIMKRKNKQSGKYDFKMEMSPELQKGLDSVIDGLEDKIVVTDPMLKYHVFNLDGVGDVRPYRKDRGEGILIDVKRHIKNVGLAGVDKIHTPNGDVYLDWHKGAEKFVKAITDIHLERYNRLYGI